MDVDADEMRARDDSTAAEDVRVTNDDQDDNMAKKTPPPPSPPPPRPPPPPPPSLFIHTSSETFLIYPQGVAAQSSENDNSLEKENAQVGVGSASVWRYTIAVVVRAPPKNAQKDELVLSPADASPVPPTPPADVAAIATTAASPAPPAEPAKEAAVDDSEDMSISPSESSKPSVNGDAEPAAETAGLPGEEKAGEARLEQPAAVNESAAEAANDEEQGKETTAEDASKTRVDGSAEEERAELDSAEDAARPSAAESKPVSGSLPDQLRPPSLKERAPKKLLSALQVLQRNLTEEELVFDADGVGVVSKEVENGARKGWKIEAKSWRVAGADALPLIETVVL